MQHQISSEKAKADGLPLLFLLFTGIFSVLTVGLWLLFLLLSGESEILKFLLPESPVAVYQEELKERIVILDAGHGGEDGGASGGGLIEKDLNLSLAISLSELLRANGITVILTREDDRLLYDPSSDYEGRKKMLDLVTRKEIAEEIAEKYPSSEILFISLHMNAFPSEKECGLQVWYSPNDTGSQRLAEEIQATVREKLDPGNRRKIKKAGTNIYLLDRIESPAILIECGFLSSPEDVSRFQSEEYRASLLLCLFSGIQSYFETEQ